MTAVEVAYRRSEDLLKLPGVTAVGVGRKTSAHGGEVECIVIFALPSTDRNALPQTLDGIEVDVRMSGRMYPSRVE
jgi:hypothetical protein